MRRTCIHVSRKHVNHPRDCTIRRPDHHKSTCAATVVVRALPPEAHPNFGAILLLCAQVGIYTLWASAQETLPSSHPVKRAMQAAPARWQPRMWVLICQVEVAGPQDVRDTTQVET